MSTTLSDNFSANLKRWRGSTSQHDAALKLGLGSQQAYAKYENGVVPRAAGLERIAEKLGVKAEDLLRPGGVAGATEPSTVAVPVELQHHIAGAAEVLGLDPAVVIQETLRRHWRETARALQAEQSAPKLGSPGSSGVGPGAEPSTARATTAQEAAGRVLRKGAEQAQDEARKAVVRLGRKGGPV